MLKQKLTIFIFILGLFLPLAYLSAGTVLSSNKYAWSNNVGYINFENVIVENSALSGYAWSTNKGLIKFNPALGGVLNDGTGNLSGSAWGEQLGWIDFDNVSINGTTGKFSGTASGALVGTITFDCPNYCDVQTDWRQAVSSQVVPPSGGGRSFPVVNITPANLSNPIILNNVPLNTGFFTTVNSLQGVPVVNNLPPPAENPPLFDVVSAPIQLIQADSVPLIVFFVGAGVLLSVLILFFVNKFRAYKITKGKIKNENFT